LRPQAGFSTYRLLEIIIVVCLVLILAAVAADRLLPLRGAAEAARFENTLGAMRSGLGAAAVQQVLHSPRQNLRELARRDPLSLLSLKPDHGSGPTLPADGIAPGSWFYARNSHTLYYRVEYPQYFEGGYGSPPLIRMQIRVRGNENASVPRDLALVVIDRYRWTGSGVGQRVGQAEAKRKSAH